MTATPKRNELNTSVLTPVRFLDSPKSKIDPQGIRSRLEDILKTLVENQRKWHLAQIRGISLCRSIEAVKVKSIENTDCSPTSSDHTRGYPLELQEYCDKLKIILTIFEDISLSTKSLYKQILALSKLQKDKDEVFFRTWKLKHFFEFIQKVNILYDKEYKLKKLITEEIAHGSTREELTLSSCIWEYPEYTNDEFQLKFRFLMLEIQKT